MWQYLILNSLWFFLLFGIPFFKKRELRYFLLFCAVVGIFSLAIKSYVDPFAWFYYLCFGIFVFFGGQYFRQWVMLRLSFLDDEIKIFDRKLSKQKKIQELLDADVDRIGSKAAEVSRICEGIKAMSQSLEIEEAFYRFCEAASAEQSFNAATFVHCDLLSLEPVQEESLRLTRQSMKNISMRAGLLREAVRLKSGFNEWEKHWIKSGIQQKTPFVTELPKMDELKMGVQAQRSDEKFFVYPSPMSDGRFALLMIDAVSPTQVPLYTILCDHFFAELERIDLYEKVQALAITDGLTQVPVRRYFMERLEDEIKRSIRMAQKLSLLMVDVDHFKAFNDRYGHLVGDAVLRHVANLIRKSLREADFVGRYGGEEFSVFLPDTDEGGALYAAERIRKAVAEKGLEVDGELLLVTVSIGCMTVSDVSVSSREMIDAADGALYDAKKQGRNRVCLGVKFE